MTVDIYCDGNVFSFAPEWVVRAYDEEPDFQAISGCPFAPKACDIVALRQNELYLIEAKDYDYPTAVMPTDLSDVVARKAFDTLAGLSAFSRCSVNHDFRHFAQRAQQCDTLTVCLTVELRGDSLNASPNNEVRAAIRDKLHSNVRRFTNRKPIVTSNRHQVAPWSSWRDPASRECREF